MSRLLTFLVALLWGGAACAQALTGLARLDPALSGIALTRQGVEITLGLSQPVPYRVYTLDAPRRLVLDFSMVDFAAAAPDLFLAEDRVLAARMGAVQPGWSRLVLDLGAPLAITEAWMDTEGGAQVTVRLKAVPPETFVALSGAPASALFAFAEPADLPPPLPRQDGSRPIVVMLDPGHGGIDPGAVRGEAVEAELMLTFARELREILQRAGGFDVRMTRDADVFVPLERRVAMAHMAGADVFLSLHADAIPEGRARGATIYTLSETASDIASEKLAERHDRADLLAGIDLTAQDDAVAHVLMDLARLETRPRTDSLADALVAGLQSRIAKMHKRPRLEASFSVLKAPDIPSVLIELGFLSSEEDRANLLDPAWRQKAALGIRDALVAWAKTDAAEAALLRQ